MWLIETVRRSTENRSGAKEWKQSDGERESDTPYNQRVGDGERRRVKNKGETVKERERDRERRLTPAGGVHRGLSVPQRYALRGRDKAAIPAAARPSGTVRMTPAALLS